MNQRNMHPRWCQPPCRAAAGGPTGEHRSREATIGAIQQETMRIRARLTTRDTLGSPVLVTLEIFDDSREGDTPYAVVPLSLRQADHVGSAVQSLLRIAVHGNWSQREV